MSHKLQSPPLTPIHTRRTSQQAEKSPTLSYRSHLRRRTSSFSSNHDRSPITPRSQHNRFSNASAYSGQLGSLGDELETVAGAGGGLGNLADELDQLSDGEGGEEEEEEEEEEGEDYAHDDDTTHDENDARHTHTEAVRDSGVDVSFGEEKQVGNERNRDQHDEEPPDDWPASLEDITNDLARIVTKAADAVGGDDAIAQYRQAMVKMLPLDDQVTLESSAQRLNTSTNSVATHITQEAKSMQMLGVSLFSPFGGLRDTLDYQALEDSLPLFDSLLQDLAQPDQTLLQGIQKLAHETQNIIQTNLSLSDTMQEFNRPINDAARHLREARKQVERYRLEQEEADLARLELGKSQHAIEHNDSNKAATVCKDIVSGFESFCDNIRQTWSEAA